MTYCLAIKLNAGLVFVSDSRTNAGVDQISTYSKMHTFGIDGQRQFCLLTAGNLATSQGIVNQVKHDINQGMPMSLMTMKNLEDAADYVGQVSVMQQQKTGGGPDFEASIIFGGQIQGAPPDVVLIYPQGNHISTSSTTPFLQIGESKYGKPILDRIIAPDTALHTAVLCGLVSMDSTMRSNVTVGPPIEVLAYATDSLVLKNRLALDEDSDYLRELKRNWDARLKDAFRSLPHPAWASAWDHPVENPGSGG
ncbi:MAG: peptidase [Gammaproteobacteria bacterium]|nr:peptidase [Gammaproteobacteria bacterium]